jgi:hypothetical protein
MRRTSGLLVPSARRVMALMVLACCGAEPDAGVV